MVGLIKLDVLVAGLVLTLCSQELLAQPELVEQVLVTARKRSEPANDVPMSLSVIDASTIETFHVSNLSDLAPLVHNVTMFEDFPGAGIPTWIIRGVGLQDFNSNNTPAAAVYADGIYQVATVMGNMALYDIDQAEILKGPQGGLYGRNTTGGAVLLNSKHADPNERQYAMSVTYSSWQQSQADGMVNLPFGDSSALRIAGRVEDGSGGWQRSLSTGEEHGAKQRWDLRSWLHFNPAADWTIDWKLQGGRDKSDIPLGRSIGLYDPLHPGQFCAAVLAGYRDDKHCINFGGVNRIAAGQPQLVEDISRQASDGSLVWSSPLNRQDNDYSGTLIEATWETPLVTFKSLSAYDQYNYGVALDLDGSAGEFGHRISSSDIKVYSQELQLLSPNHQDFTWLAGLSLTGEDFSERRDFNLRDNIEVGLGQGILNYRQATHSQAAYGDVSYQFAEGWRINADLRYTHEDKQYRDGNFYAPSPPPAYYFVQNLSADYKLDQHLSGSVAVDYKPDVDTLLYAKLSRGFKSGGFYGGFPFYTIEVKPYEAETLLAYEAGLKRSLPAYHLQVNASVFTYDYRNVQGFEHDLNSITGTAIDRLVNLADARHNGAELEVEWLPDLQWKLLASLGWLDARFVNAKRLSSNIAGNLVLMQGQRPYAPRWSGSLQLLHQQMLSGSKSLQWAFGFQFVSDFSGYQSSPVDAAINHLPGYGRLDASVTYSSAQSHWHWMLWSKNLTDKVYRTRVKDDGLNSYIEFFGEPRSVGLTASYHY